MQFERPSRTRRPAAYAVAAVLIAAAIVATVELAGSGLTSANSGLGGKFAPPPEITPARAPHR